MLLVLSPRDPHLVKSAQTRQNAATDPTAEFPLRQRARGVDADSRPRIGGGQFLIKAFGEAGNQARSAGDDNTAE